MVSGDRRESEDYEHIDVTQWRPANQPIVTPERAAKGDLVYNTPCSECNGRGSFPDPYGRGIVPCRTCHGRGTNQVIGDIALQHVRFAQAQVQNVMNWLWERGTLDDQHLHDGQTYEQWQMVQQARLGLRRKVAASGEATDGDDLRERGFTLLLIRVPARHQKWIDHAVHTNAASGHVRFIAQRNCRFYREAFDCLSGKLPPIMEELKALREAKGAN
ncbi:MAG: hypothetical protein BGO49_24530 [Planctomycetales bacterium 71-10]|nr:MAG: hypothetical protein BGO49_24530 [Planctomycetales bacterium 71-10]